MIIFFFFIKAYYAIGNDSTNTIVNSTPKQAVLVLNTNLVKCIMLP